MKHQQQPPPLEVVLSEEVAELVLLKKMSEDLQFAHSVLATATPEIFSNKPLAKIFAVYRDFYLKNPKGYFNINVLKNTTHNENGVLTPFIDEINKINLADYGDAVILDNASRFISQQKMSIAVRFAVDVLQNPEKKDDKNFAKVTEMMSNATFSTLTTDSGLYYFENIKERYKRLAERHKVVVKTGVKVWDDQLTSTDNGLVPGSLTVIAGQANIGKSIALGNLAMNAVQAGKKVVLISFEMDQDIYAARLDAAVANVNHNDLLHHRERIYDAVDDYRKKYNQVGKGNLVIKQFPTSTMTPAQLRSYLIRLRSEFEFDMVVVDYLNLMLSDRSSSGDSLYVKIKTISEDLRALSVYFMVPIVTATQLNRAGYNVKPAENNIAECIALMATADIIIALYQMDTDKDADIIRSIFIKNRYGPKQKEFIHSICFAYMRILDGVTVSPTLAVPDQSNFGKLFGNEMALATLMNLEPQAPAVPPVNNVQQS